MKPSKPLKSFHFLVLGATPAGTPRRNHDEGTGTTWFEARRQVARRWSNPDGTYLDPDEVRPAVRVRLDGKPAGEP